MVTKCKVENAHYLNKIFKKSIREIFPHAKNKERKVDNIGKILSNINKLRNRVFHHEPVWGYHDLEKKYHNIIKVINWIDPNIKLWLYSSKNIDRFPEIYNQYSQEVIQITQFKKSSQKNITKSILRKKQMQQGIERLEDIEDLRALR